MALAGVLVSPSFLFRLEPDPADIAPKTPYRVSDLELASRLSFFLWSSIPDDELLNVAIAGKLHEPAVLERQVRRMLADARSRALVDNFASQWLHLRNLAAITPDMRLFPDFDDNLRQAFRQETELFFESVLREDRSVLDLLRANYTFLNERLAKHYGIPQRLRQPVPAHRARRGQRARRPAPPGQHPDRDLVRDAHVARRSRQVDPRQPARRAAAAAAARRARRSRTTRLTATSPFASGWPSIAATRRAPPATT